MGGHDADGVPAAHVVPDPRPVPVPHVPPKITAHAPVVPVQQMPRGGQLFASHAELTPCVKPAGQIFSAVVHDPLVLLQQVTVTDPVRTVAAYTAYPRPKPTRVTFICAVPVPATSGVYVKCVASVT